jgi:hypothetical protein
MAHGSHPMGPHHGPRLTPHGTLVLTPHGTPPCTGIGHVFTDGWPSADAAKAALRKPSAEYDVFVVDQDYGYQSVS